MFLIVIFHSSRDSCTKRPLSRPLSFRVFWPSSPLHFSTTAYVIWRMRVPGYIAYRTISSACEIRERFRLRPFSLCYTALLCFLKPQTDFRRNARVVRKHDITSVRVTHFKNKNSDNTHQRKRIVPAHKLQWRLKCYFKIYGGGVDNYLVSDMHLATIRYRKTRKNCNVVFPATTVFGNNISPNSARACAIRVLLYTGVPSDVLNLLLNATGPTLCASRLFR